MQNIMQSTMQNMTIKANYIQLRTEWRFSTILKTTKKVHEVMLFDMEKDAYSESVFDTLYIEIKHKC